MGRKADERRSQTRHIVPLRERRHLEHPKTTTSSHPTSTSRCSPATWVKPGTGCARLGGHQEGYVRPDYPGKRPGVYVEKLLAEGKGPMLWWVLACNPIQTAPAARTVLDVIQERGKESQRRPRPGRFDRRSCQARGLSRGRRRFVRRGRGHLSDAGGPARPRRVPAQLNSS